MIRFALTACAAMSFSAAIASAQMPSALPPTAPVAQPVAPQPVVNQVQGQIFTYPVPQGWRLVTESINEVYVAAPDGSMALGFTGLERMMVGNSQQFLQQILQMYGCRDLRIVSGQRLPVQNADAVEGIITYTQNNMPRKAWVRVVVMQQNGFGNGYMLVAAAAPERFDAAVPTMKRLCERIQVTNQSAAFDRARAYAAQQPVTVSGGASLNRPMDDSVTSGYWARQKTTDDASARRSNFARDTYVSTDTTTGTEYYHGQAAYDPTRGGVVNPERPTETLAPADHWQGHQ